MFALVLLIHRSHNTARDGETREWLFEGANCPLDTGYSACCKTLSVSCDHLLRVCDCSLSLSVVGSKRCVHLLSTLSACSVKLAAPARCHGGSDTLKITWMGFFCLIGSPLFETASNKGFPLFIAPQPLERELQSKDGIITDHPVASRTTSRGK